LEKNQGNTPRSVNRKRLSTYLDAPQLRMVARLLWLAIVYFAQDSSRFPVLLPFFDTEFRRSFLPFHRHPARLLGPGGVRSLAGCGVASSQAPTPDCESLPATIAQSALVGPHSRRLAGALGASHSSAPFRNCIVALDIASPPQRRERAKV
jgi:hypothetical protein